MEYWVVTLAVAPVVIIHQKRVVFVARVTCIAAQTNASFATDVALVARDSVGYGSFRTVFNASAVLGVVRPMGTNAFVAFRLVLIVEVSIRAKLTR